MNQDIFEQDLINILGRNLEESRMIDDKMEGHMPRSDR